MKKIIAPWQSLLLLIIWVIAASCQKQNAVSPAKKEKQFDLSGFNKIIAGENFTVNVIKSKSFSIKATGAEEDLEDLGLTVLDGQLCIKFKRFKLTREKISFVIAVPAIEMLQLHTAAKGSVTGFQDQPLTMSAVLTGISIADLYGTGMRVSINVSGNSMLSLSGNTASLQGILSGSGQLHAYGLNAKEANVKAIENAIAYIIPTDVLYANVSGNGQIFYKGDPSMHLEINENGQVIQE